MQVVPVEEQLAYGEVVGVTEQPAPASGVVVGVLTEQPGASSGGAARGSLEFLGRWNEKRSDRAMPIKLKAERETETMVRVALGKLVDELVQTNASSGILAIGNWRESRGGDRNRVIVTVWGFSWSASLDDASYQRHGEAQLAAEEEEKKAENATRFADFEGVVDDFGDEDQIAVYRVTLPSRGLDPDKWVGRPPPPAPEELYTGPRSDELVCTEEISGDYSAACACVHGLPVSCNSMTVVPLGADTIETWRTGCVFFPPFIGPVAEGAVRTRNPGTNAFLNPQNPPFNPDPNSNLMTFSADGTARATQGCGSFKKRPGSQKRAFQKVETRDLAGKWCGLRFVPFVPCWPLSFMLCTTKTALNEDQYEESGLAWILGLPGCMCGTRTRIYVNGHPTNGFAGALLNDNDPDLVDQWHRDPGCAGSFMDGGLFTFFAKKVG